MSSKNTREIRNVETYKADTFKMAICKEYITMDFGKIFNTDDEGRNINVVSSISMEPKLLKPYVLKLMSAAIAYQEEYNVDLGFNVEKSKKNNKEEA